ncbi:hypothetical protein NMG60_11029775 [Bertholletia excelsa]
MKARSRGELQALVLISLLISNAQVAAKSVIEPCNSNDSCPALLAYRLPWGSSFSDIASRFQVNISEILAANNIDPARPLSRSYQVLAANSLVKVPVSCSCVDGIRWSISTAYTVRAADTFYSISQGYGELVSPQQIRSVNGVNETTAKGGLVAGQRMVVPLPCTCFGNRNNGAEAVYMSYVVEKGENLSGIADAYGTTVTDLETVNGLTLPRVRPRDILSVPLPACSLTNLNWHNESLTVANGSYALTANNCINCGCAPTDLSLQCSPSGIAASCTHLQCKGSTLFIGQAYEKRADFGCNLTACVYRGHLNNKIFSRYLYLTKLCMCVCVEKRVEAIRDRSTSSYIILNSRSNVVTSPNQSCKA